MAWLQGAKRYFLTGLLVLVPAWGTFLILHALFTTLDGLIASLLGRADMTEIPGLGLATFVVVILTGGILATHFLGQRVLHWTDQRLERIPLVGSIYLTLKGVTDLFKFRERFGRSAVVVFPFPRRGLWALGFVMGPPPTAVQAAVSGTPVGRPLTMVFVPTAIHPFTGYLAFIPKTDASPVNLPAEDAIKMEFSAGLYQPRHRWLSQPTSPAP